MNTCEEVGGSTKLQISEIQIIPIKPLNGLVGFASCVINGSMYLGSIGIHSRPEGGYRLSYPTKRVGERSINIFYPINKESAQQIENAITSHFEQLIAKSISEENNISYSNRYENF